MLLPVSFVTSSAPVGANGSPLDVVGHVKIPVIIGAFNTEQVFVVVSKLTVAL